MEVEIRSISGMADLQKMAELERTVWGMDSIPLHQTLTAAKNGGVLLGAFDREELVGFLYSFPGFRQGETYLCSHMMGIHPNYRNQSIGFRLKQKQAEVARQMGYQKIRWTYDPLESRNAHLNIAKLGAICEEYIENCYGELEGELNKGLPTDRFNVEWRLEDRDWIKSKIESAKPTFEEAHNLIQWSLQQGFPVVEKMALEKLGEKQAEFLFVPIPIQFQEIKAKNPEMALEWRFRTREIFQQAFQQNWVVVHTIGTATDPVQYYVLAQRTFLEADPKNLL